MIADLSKLKLGSEFERPCEFVSLERVLTFPGRLKNLLAVDKKGRFIYPSGSFLLIDGESQLIHRGHDSQITAIAYSQAGNLIASGQAASKNAKDYESPVILWDNSSNSMRKVLLGLKNGVKALAFSRSGQYLAGLSQKNFLIIWSVASLTILHQRVYEFAVEIVAYFDTLIFSIGSNLHELALRLPGQPLQSNFTMPTSGMKRGYTACVQLPDKSLLFSTSAGQLAHFDKSVFKNVFIVGKGEVSSMVHDGTYLYVAVGEEFAKLQFTGGKMVEKKRTFLGFFLKGLVVGPNRCVYGQSAGSLLELSSELEAKIVIEANKQLVAGLSCFGSSIATIDSTQCRIFDCKSLHLVAKCVNPSMKPIAPSCVALGADLCVVGWQDGSIRGFRLSGKKEEQPLWQVATGHKSQVSTIFVSENYILSGGVDSVVRIWARSNRQQLNQLSVHQKEVTRVIPDLKDPSLIHSCSLDKTVHSYSLKTDKKEGYHQSKNGTLSDMAQVPGSNNLVTVGFNAGLSVWTVKDFYPLHHQDIAIRLTKVSTSPDGSLLAVGNQFGEVWMFQTGKFSFLGRLQGHSLEVTGLAWLSAKSFVSTSLDGSLALWLLK